MQRYAGFAMTTIYHNPRCSKSRAALELLQQQGITPEVVLYLEQMPTAAALEKMVAMLDVRSSALVKTGRKSWD